MKSDTIIQLFPNEIRPLLEKAVGNAESLTEIRIRCDRPVFIVRGRREYVLSGQGEEIATGRDRCISCREAVCFDQNQMEQIFHHICRYSPYAYEEELKNGFLTVAGGHRVGVAGQVLAQEGRVQSIRNIRFLNIRISHEILGCADSVMDKIYDRKGNRWYSTMVIAPPACGKTTLLRDMIRQISDGAGRKRAQTVGVVDERSEIAGCFFGCPQNDVGMRTDVLDGCPKAYGMEMLLRSMAPDVIAVDEIATERDVDTLLLMAHCGITILATVHGDHKQSLLEKQYLQPLFAAGCFQRFVVLSQPGVVTIFNEKGEAL